MLARQINSRFALGLCAALFLASSLVLYRAVPISTSHLDHDSYGYDAIAVHFAQTGDLSDPLNSFSAPIQPVGYPLFLGIIYRLFGHDYVYVVFFQVLLCILSGMVFFSMVRQLFDERSALLCIALSALNLGFLVYPQFLLAEMLCLFFILLFFERFLYFLRSDNCWALITAGLLLAVSVLIKPMALLYVFFLLPVIFFNKKKITWCLFFLISFYAPIISYMSYNYYHYNTFALAPMTELNLYQCFLSKVIAHVEHVPVEHVLATTLAFTGANSFDSSGWDHAKKIFFQYIKEHPCACVYVWCRNVLKTVCGLYSTQLKVLIEPKIKGGDHSFFKMSGTVYQRAMTYIFAGSTSLGIKSISLLEALWSVFRWILFIVGFFVLLRKKNYVIIWLFGSFIVQSAFVTGMDGCCRYRVMFEPLLIVFAVVGLLMICSWSRKVLGKIGVV